jgi:hypothetical protein
VVTDGAVGVAVGTIWLQPGNVVAVGAIVVTVEPVVVLIKIKTQLQMVTAAIGPITFKVNHLLVQVGPLQDKVAPDCATCLKFFHN